MADPVHGGSSPEEVMVPLDRVAKFVRQLAHDLRNHLGSMDLQAAFVAELSTDAELSAELKKLRAMITGAAKSIQGVSGQFSLSKANPFALKAAILVEDLRDRLDKLFPEDAPKIQWQVELADEMVHIDLEMMFTVFSELFRNALSFHDPICPIEVKVGIVDGCSFVLEIEEHLKALELPVSQWGVVPMVSTRRAGYGLGLFHARQLLELQGGHVEFILQPNGKVVKTRLSLPLITPEHARA